MVSGTPPKKYILINYTIPKAKYGLRNTGFKIAQKKSYTNIRNNYLKNCCKLEHALNQNSGSAKFGKL